MMEYDQMEVVVLLFNEFQNILIAKFVGFQRFSKALVREARRNNAHLFSSKFKPTVPEL